MDLKRTYWLAFGISLTLFIIITIFVYPATFRAIGDKNLGLMLLFSLVPFGLFAGSLFFAFKAYTLPSSASAV